MRPFETGRFGPVLDPLVAGEGNSGALSRSLNNSKPADWFSNRGLLDLIGDIPPAEVEVLYYENQETPAMVAGLK